MMRSKFIPISVILCVLLFSGCDALDIITSKGEAAPAESVTIRYDTENNPYYESYVQRVVADEECIDNNIRIQPGESNSGIIEYTYNGGGLLSDPEGNVYFYDEDGFIYDKEGNPNSDRVTFRQSSADYCAGIAARAGKYAKTFDESLGELDDVSNVDDSSVKGSPPTGSVPEAYTANAICKGNVSWKDFYPNAPDYWGHARIELFTVTLSLDFENGEMRSDFCGVAEDANDGWSQGSADYCVTIKDSELYQEIDGTWAFDGVWDVDLEMSGAQLHWVDNTEEWAYSGQQGRFDAPFHGWLEPGNGSLYTDEVLPATFQFLCDFVPLDGIFN